MERGFQIRWSNNTIIIILIIYYFCYQGNQIVESFQNRLFRWDQVLIPFKFFLLIILLKKRNLT